MDCLKFGWDWMISTFLRPKCSTHSRHCLLLFHGVTHMDQFLLFKEWALTAISQFCFHRVRTTKLFNAISLKLRCFSVAWGDVQSCAQECGSNCDAAICFVFLGSDGFKANLYISYKESLAYCNFNIRLFTLSCVWWAHQKLAKHACIIRAGKPSVLKMH